ncbi:PTS system D-mannitol-specific IIA component, Fru family /PTS system D-mannitol-specific IIB component, Fru family /PTS system D-mannitol-specific IIC component, Fru family [Kosakonia oryzendophytica]|uniref:PTS system mannitol-specific EIICBA component n=1 Tax=Kosakonia oryzendophytica TaxID=1005665 RepID=A0A1C4BXQ2_9ENTR|nr:PTS mannitol transporter subunit IICBA [Kosakonia oryzendophytica]TDT51679.1 PTS system D-mannitol-specific IIA component (Fru family) /PTS system D-mannitol-specific IIB component (Fru family) /PTS system D-mannitol-specific IIC component (Fru family) [Enterobacter sp. AG5470]SCC11590.1 PTS system D-mannitol-specific IIA component, Fru family /PTS system D-mannitol-specific IIB component, Fru family /PTS system D-mannitol-specific IIC component, Fru family [Kosakonia oryzendophytica]
MSSDIKIKVQSFGRFLSNMVMPNIGAFIAWGIITALFIPTGWLPNETLAKLVGPMITYLLPLLIGFTGGRLVGGDRGGVVGAITTMGVIVGADMPMFLGAMIAGPLGGFCIKKFDAAVDGKIKSGFEMLVNNFSAGIIGMILAILAFLGIGPAVEVLSKVLSAGVNFMVVHDMLPLASIFVEPAKILFLNNAINHGIFSPLGIQQSHDIGKSIFFLIEANPGPGMGVLLAYMFFGRGSAKQSAGGAAIIHFLGGIHEIYFPYVLMNPRLLLAVILGGMTGVFTLSVLNGGLVSPASPGSILAVLAMTPKGAYFANLTAIFAALIVSFVIASILLKTSKVKEEDEDIEAATRRMQDMKAQSKGATPLAAGDVTNDLSHVRKIIVACDAGMGSSAMGAGVLRKKVQDAGLTNISVTNCAINSLPSDVDLVITHRDLTERAMRQAPQAQHISLTNFLDSGLYTGLTERLVAAQRHNDNQTKVNSSLQDSFDASNSNLFKLGAENIFLGRKASNKEEAIRFAGEQLVKGGYVQPEYVDAMLEREKLTPTYLGESIAVPHGTVEAKDRVLKTGVVFCQYPEGVRFGEGEEDIARLVIGIAARNNEHIQVITSLTNALDDETVIERLAHTTSVEEVLALIGK